MAKKDRKEKRQRGGGEMTKEGCAKCEIQIAAIEIQFKAVLRNKDALQQTKDSFAIQNAIESRKK